MCPAKERATHVSVLHIGSLAISERDEIVPEIDPVRAIDEKEFDKLASFLRLGGDANTRDVKGRSLLNIALNNKDEIAVDILLGAGVDPNQVTM